MHASDAYRLAIGHLRQAARSLPAGAPASCTGNFRLRYLQFAADLESLAEVGDAILAEAENARPL